MLLLSVHILLKLGYSLVVLFTLTGIMAYGGVEFNPSLLKQSLRRTGTKLQNEQHQPSSSGSTAHNEFPPQVKLKPTKPGKTIPEIASKPTLSTSNKVPPTTSTKLPFQRENTIDMPEKKVSVLELSKRITQQDPATTTASSSNTKGPSPPPAPKPTPKSKPPPPTRNSSLHPTPSVKSIPDTSNELPEEVYDDIQEYSAMIRAMKTTTNTQPAAVHQPSSPAPPTPTSPPLPQPTPTGPPLPPPNTLPGTNTRVVKSPSVEALNTSERKTDSRPNSTYSGHYNSSTLPTRGNKGSPLKRNNVSTTYKELEEPMGLGEFVNKYQNRFPTQMKMCSNHSGVITINNGDIYNVHFLKNTDVVSLTASGGTQYFVPINSAIEFGIVYNPTNNVQDALQGFVFATAGEIISTGSTPPPIIYVQQNCEISSQESSVQVGDVLVVNEVKSKLLRGKMLMCTDIRTEQKKRLLDSCSGNFSTTPSQVKLFLPQLLRHVPFPQYCVLSYNGYGNDAQNIASKLPRGIVEVTRTTTQQSIIVSKEYSDELLEFPITNNVTVQPIQPSETVTQNLMIDTKQKYNSFSPVSVKSMSLMLSMESPYTLTKQVALLSAPRSDTSSLIGVKLVKPGSPPPPEPPSNIPIEPPPTSLPEDDDDDPDYQIPCLARELYNSKTAQQKTSAPNSPGLQGPAPTPSHYDTPRSSLGTISTKSTIPESTSIEDDDDDDIYDIPCQTPSPTLTKANKPINNSKQKKKSSFDRGVYSSTGGTSMPLPPPPNTPLPVIPPVNTQSTSTSTKQQQQMQPVTMPAIDSNSPSLQAEVNRLKEETKTLKSTVEKLDSMFSGLASSIGRHVNTYLHKLPDFIIYIFSEFAV